MKNDIMGDLDDFMNQVAASDVKLPEQFDEVVDLLQPVPAIEYQPIAPKIQAQLDKHESEDLRR